MKEPVLALIDKVSGCNAMILLVIIVTLISYYLIVKMMLAYCESTKKEKRRKNDRLVNCFNIWLGIRLYLSLIYRKSCQTQGQKMIVGAILFFVFASFFYIKGVKKFLDSVNEKKVLDFYRKNGFVALNESKEAVSVKMVRMFD